MILSRSQLAFLHDLIAAFLCFGLALFLRVGTDAFDKYDYVLVAGTVATTVMAAGVFPLIGMYRGVWRYASVADLMAIMRGVSLVVLLMLPALFVVNRLESMPRSVPVIQWLLLVMMLGFSRLIYRVYKDHRAGRKLAREKRLPILLIGAGDEAESFIRGVVRNPQSGYDVVGLVAVRIGRVGRRIHEVPVIGRLDEIEAAIEALQARGRMPQKILVATDAVTGAEVRALFDLATRLGITLARLPRMTDFRALEGGNVQVRPIAVEDLLGRPQAVLDREGIAHLIGDRRLLVTGAGGSIGGELVRQIAALKPSHLTLVEASEYALYKIDREIRESFPTLPVSAVIADVRDRQRLGEVFGQCRPELVFHAAALKHVPLVELNPVEGVLTNTIGSRNVADLCLAHKVQAMVMISTDKAVNPTNVMGATKRLAEAYCQSLDSRGLDTRFITVRFGNVLGSTGSVVPLFQRQLAAGGPLTVTHPDVVRYFMTIREAVELVLQASSHGLRNRDDQGKIYVLDMGEPVRIVDLARQMIRLAGLRPEQDVKIEFTGLRPGEKLFEEIFHGAEPPQPTAVEGLLIAAPRSADHAIMAAALDEVEREATRRNGPVVLERLMRLVPEFTPDPQLKLAPDQGASQN